MKARLLLSAIACVVAVGCGGVSAEDTESSAAGFLNALAAQDYDAAYALTSPGYRQSHDVDSFRAAARYGAEQMRTTPASCTSDGIDGTAGSANCNGPTDAPTQLTLMADDDGNVFVTGVSGGLNLLLQ